MWKRGTCLNPESILLHLKFMLHVPWWVLKWEANKPRVNISVNICFIFFYSWVPGMSHQTKYFEAQVQGLVTLSGSKSLCCDPYFFKNVWNFHPSLLQVKAEHQIKMFHSGQEVTMLICARWSWSWCILVCKLSEILEMQKWVQEQLGDRSEGCFEGSSTMTLAEACLDPEICKESCSFFWGGKASKEVKARSNALW